ncbi:MAG: hypothetical protein J5685_12915, partial [Clostridiales bacterium]|nr:hypothetical protein [Clostridiales bacterium]
MKTIKITKTTALVLAAMMLCFGAASCSSSKEVSGSPETTANEVVSEPSGSSLPAEAIAAYNSAYSVVDECAGVPVCLLKTYETEDGINYVIMEHAGFLSYSGSEVYRIKVFSPSRSGESDYEFGPETTVSGVSVGNPLNEEIFSNPDSDDPFEVTPEEEDLFNSSVSDMEAVAVLGVRGGD